ncbi:uncharacterized protein LOC113305798 [Papaver somniferum]|uniref:uncharacterized protein LOC113305798 n=1 Tax=Papaver somniferum TaxID=3469 RepID=UPI000E700943|nr:uncharacterized protein LOC113305798 [Papaver somniferum]
MASYLGNHQFGVGIPCRGEVILHSDNRLLELKGGHDNMTMLLVDFSNAFNLVDRTTMVREVRSKCPSIARWVDFCYAKPARLYYNEFTLYSSLDVPQGDPLGPLLSALTLHPLVCMISLQCRLDLHTWYLDDGTLVGDTLEVSKALSIIQSEGGSSGIHLNIKKTEIFWLVVDPRSLDDSVFPLDIGRPFIGVKLLGGSVSFDLQFCSDLIWARVDKTVTLMDVIKKLKYLQSKLLFLRSCIGVSRLYISLRTTNPLALESAKNLYDQQLFQFLRHIVTGDVAGFGHLQQRIATLPMKDGGLGVYTMEDTNYY